MGGLPGPPPPAKPASFNWAGAAYWFRLAALEESKAGKERVVGGVGQPLPCAQQEMEPFVARLRGSYPLILQPLSGCDSSPREPFAGFGKAFGEKRKVVNLFI